MLAPLLVALIAPQGLQIDGLAPGERFEVLPAVSAPVSELERFDEGCVVDARTGFPVAGAQLEAWTEETSERGAGFRRVGEATTGPDGLFRLRVQDGALRGDKVRVRAAGYLTLSTTEGDGLVQLMPVQGDPPLLRVIDLQDRPIPNARITSSYSCSHDVPAFDVRTDAFGIARLPEWGLQDQTPQLRVRADGYGAIEYLDSSEVLADQQMLADGEVPVVRLARRRALRARALDRAGRPLVATPLHVVDGEGYHVPVTADDGRFEVLAPYNGRGEVTLYALRGGEQEFVFVGRLPAAPTVGMRLDARNRPEGTPEVEVTVEFAGVDEDAVRPELLLFHEDGWTEDLRRKGEASGTLPPGEALLLVGGAFSGWEEQLLELELIEGRPARLQLAPRREPTLTVLTQPDEAQRLLVEAGDDSIEVRPAKSGQTTLSVPAGRTVTLLSEGSRSRRLVIPALEADATADLRAKLCLLPLSVAQRRAMLERTALRVRLVAADGSTPLAGELSAEGDGDPVAASVEAGVWVVEAVAGTPVLLRHRAAGHAGLQTVVHAPLPGEPASELLLSPTPLASLTIESDLELELLGPLDEGLDAVNPGPITVELLAGGRRVALALELEPGEARVLTVRERP